MRPTFTGDIHAPNAPRRRLSNLVQPSNPPPGQGAKEVPRRTPLTSHPKSPHPCPECVPPASHDPLGNIRQPRGRAAQATTGGLRRDMGFVSLTGLIVGSIVGSGIFLSASEVVAGVGSAWWALAAWTLGGIITLAGALTFAELGAAYPEAGGQTAFLREGLGRTPSFLFAWSSFSALQTGSLAAIAIAFATALDRITPLWGDGFSAFGLDFPKTGISFVAIALIWFLTFANWFGVRRGAWVNNAATFAKVGTLVVIVLVALWKGGGTGNFSAAGWTADAPTLGLFGLAVAASLFAYDGWAQATFVAAEVKNARRILPAALVVGVLGVIALYLLVNFAYLHILPAAGIAGTDLLAIDAMSAVFDGSGAATLVAAAVMIATFGAVNSWTLASPRIYFGSAQDGNFPRVFARVNRHGSPHYGLWYQAIWGSLLAMSGTFSAIALMTVFVVYVFYLLTAVAYLRLRRRQPEAFTFRSPLSPLPAWFFLIAATAILANFFLSDLASAIFGTVLILAGLPLMWALRKARPPSAAVDRASPPGST